MGLCERLCLGKLPLPYPADCHKPDGGESAFGVHVQHRSARGSVQLPWAVFPAGSIDSFRSLRGGSGGCSSHRPRPQEGVLLALWWFRGTADDAGLMGSEWHLTAAWSGSEGLVRAAS